MAIMSVVPPETSFTVMGVTLTQAPQYIPDSLAAQIAEAALQSGTRLTFDAGGSGLPFSAPTYYNAGTGPPTAGTYPTGAVCSDSQQNWWQCVSAGTPGSWQQLGEAVTGFVPLIQLGIPNGVATLDANGNVAQSPAVGTGGIAVLDSTGTPVTSRTQLQFASPAQLSDNGSTTIVTVPAATATDYSITADISDVSGSLSPTTIPFTDALGNGGSSGIPLAANREYRIDPHIIYDATSTADFVLSLFFTDAPSWVAGGWNGPDTTTTAANGVRRFTEGWTSGVGETFGGYGTGSTPHPRVHGLWRVATGTSATSLQFRFRKANTEATLATVKAHSWVDLAVVR